MRWSYRAKACYIILVYNTILVYILKLGCSRECASRILAVLRRFGLPDRSEYPGEDLYQAMLSDKKRRGERISLIERKKSQEDGRAIQVTLTDEGRTRAAEIAERRALAAADMFAVLTDEEKEQLSAILDKLGDELDAHRPKRHCKHAESEKTVIGVHPSACSMFLSSVR